MPSIVVFDTETTGVDSEKDRLVELAGCCGDFIRPNFTTLVNPQRDIPAEARAIHHIGPKDVRDAPYENEAWSAFQQHFEYPEIGVAHNAKFDVGFVNRIAPATGMEFICTYKCAILEWPYAPGHSNQVLRYYLDLDLDDFLPPELFPHRALYDAIVTRGIFSRLRDSNSVSELIRKSSGPVLLRVVTFGKHKGARWADVPFGYLKWCAGQSDMDENVLHTANYYLRGGR